MLNARVLLPACSQQVAQMPIPAWWKPIEIPRGTLERDIAKKVALSGSPRGCPCVFPIGRTLTPCTHTSMWPLALLVSLYRNRTRRSPFGLLARVNVCSCCVTSHHARLSCDRTTHTRTTHSGARPQHRARHGVRWGLSLR